MLKLIGILIIVNALVCAGWYIGSGKQWSVPLTALLTVILVVALALIFNERAIEITFGNVASVKAAATQITADAAEIASIRQRVEAQAATMDLVAKESAEATRLLKELREANHQAEEKIKAIDEKTSQIVRLPDGTMRLGNVITGTPSILQAAFEEFGKLYRAREFDKAYDQAKKCIAIYEESEERKRDVAFTTGGVTPEGAATIYAVGAELAQRHGEHTQALEWAKKAVGFAANPERKALLVTTYLNVRDTGEANKIIQEAINNSDADSIKLRELLLKIGLIKSQ